MPPPSLAEQELLQLLEHDPRNVDALLRVGWFRLQRRDWIGAREILLKAHVLEPNSPIIRIYAAHALAACHDDRAPQMLADWRSWLPLPDQQQLDLAIAMQHTDWSAEAVGVLEDLLGRSPDDRWARLSLASLYERVNRLEDAQALVDAMLRDEAFNSAAINVELRQQQASLLQRRGDIVEARKVLERAGPRTADDPDHFFELARLADLLGDEPAAIRHLAHAHGLQRRDLEETAPQRLDDAGSVFPEVRSRMSATDASKWPALVAPNQSQSPIFVVGFPRSGTTLVEQMLDAHPQLQSMDERPYLTILSDQLETHGIRVPGELDRLTQAECDELRKGYLMLACARIRRNWDASLVDKNPLNMLQVPLIHRIFPNARFVLMLRHPCDVLLSNYMQNYRSAVLMAASLDLTSLARSYVEAFEYWFHHVGLLHPSVHTIRYEELVADPAGQVDRLARYLGLDSSAPMLRVTEHARKKAFIGTPSYTQVIEPIHGRGVGHWLRYRQWLGGASRILAPILPRVGYAIEDGS